MLLIGEMLNVQAYKTTKQAVARKDEDTIISIARTQLEHGADVLDVHATTLDDQKWMLGVLKDLGCPLSVDNPDADILKICMNCEGVAYLNSISCDRLELFELARDLDLKVIGLMHNCSAEQILGGAVRYDFPKDRLLLDPAVIPVSIDPTAPVKIVKVHRQIKQEYKIKTVAGIGNISFGMPRGAELRIALLLDLYKDGLDAAIINPKEVSWFVRAADALRDPTGKAMMGYIKAFKKQAENK
jgi:5-methyltetrahydrofolate--homocysteine methyltransferase